MRNDIKNLQAICYGEILWDVLPDGPQPGGAPLNVAYHLNKLGVASAVASRIGNDRPGNKLKNLLEGWGMISQLVQPDKEYPTSEVIARMNNGNEVTYEITYPVAWDFIEPDQQLTKAAKMSKYFIFGSLACRNDITKHTLFELLETDAIKVFDINLRPPFIKKDTLKALLDKADIVKFNQAELEMVQILFNGPLGNEASQALHIMKCFDVKEVLVTKGEAGASYYKNNGVTHVGCRAVKVNDTIGSGDSFLAAFVASHYLMDDAELILKNAIAMGAFIATKKGGCPEYQLEEYEKFKSEMF